MVDLPSSADAVIVGAGIAGASTGDALAAAGLSVVVLEAEGVPGYHATGRSAAQFIPTYGPPPVWALTAASEALLRDPPPDVAPGSLLHPRPALYIAAPGDEHLLEELSRTAGSAGSPLTAVDPDAAGRLFPALRPEHVAAARLDPRSADLDVHGLHELYLRRFRRSGGALATSSRVTAITPSGSHWRVTAAGTTVTAPVVVDAAGAWGDAVASLAGVHPLGLSPRRRTAFLVPGPPGSAGWPLVADAAEAWYAKPDAGRLLCSPADESPTVPGDAKPDPIDVAQAIDVINERTTLGIRSVSAQWAGLRTFSPDRVPVAGEDPTAPGFVWLVGQGGYGIQTAPAMGDLVAALITGTAAPVPSDVVTALSPARLR